MAFVPAPSLLLVGFKLERRAKVRGCGGAGLGAAARALAGFGAATVAGPCSAHTRWHASPCHPCACHPQKETSPLDGSEHTIFEVPSDLHAQLKRQIKQLTAEACA